MFLKALQIKGFKSFADGATLDLEPGVTVVVGPNGSGKSNVVDAIGWVLGAQAPSAVRSQKMDDVIFAGSAKRPALGRAEVSLTIDNTSKLLPIEFFKIVVHHVLGITRIEPGVFRDIDQGIALIVRHRLAIQATQLQDAEEF